MVRSSFRSESGSSAQKYLVLAATSAALLAGTRTAEAQLNYRDVPLGGRTASMGGVGTAAGSDGAMPYLNPAGVSSVHGDIFALSAQVYSLSHRGIDKFFHPKGLGYQTTNVDESFTSDQVLNYPSSVMYMKHTNDPDAKFHSVVAISLVVPAAQKYSIAGTYKASRPDVNGGVSESKSVQYDATDLYFGPTYSLGIGKKLNLGATLYMLYSTSRLNAHESHLEYEFGGARTSSTDVSITEEHRSTAIVPILGAQYELVEGLRLGAAVAIPSIRIKGHHHLVENDNEEGDVDERDNTSMDAEGYSNRPLRVNFGISYERPKSMAIGADVHWYAPRDQGFGYEGHARTHSLRSNDVARDYQQTRNERDDLRSVVDVSVGGELWVADWLALRAGAFTNRAPLPLNPQERYMMEVERKGISLGVGILSGPFETTLGAVYQHGKGRIVIEDHTSAQANAGSRDQLVPVGFDEHTVSFILAGVVTTEEAKDTIQKELEKK